VSVRYVAALAPISDEEMTYAVVRLVEDDEGNRISSPVFVIGEMTQEQTEHLWMQLGKALGKVEAHG
jgi:hypothetical protein